MVKKPFYPIAYGILFSLVLMVAVAKTTRTQIQRESNILHPVQEGTIEVNYGEYSLNVITFDKDDNVDSNKDFELLEKKTSDIDGTFSFFIKDLSTGKVYKYNEDEIYFAASLYKVPVAIATFVMIEDGEFNLDSDLLYTYADYADGSGSIVNNGPNKTYTVEDTLNRLLKNSDNAAQNMLMRYLPDEIEKQAFQEATSTQDSNFYAEQESTVTEISNVFEYLYETSKGTKEGIISKENAQMILELMSKTSFDDRIHLGLTKETVFSHKIGNWGETNSWHDCGVVYKNDNDFLVCAMSKNATFENVEIAYKLVGEFIENQR